MTTGIVSLWDVRSSLDRKDHSGRNPTDRRSNPAILSPAVSDYLIIAACEIGGSIVNYLPQHTIILNLALDHHTVD